MRKFSCMQIKLLLLYIWHKSTLKLFHVLNYFSVESFINLFIFTKEVINGRHNLRWSSTKEFPQTMLSIFLSLFFVIKHSLSTTTFAYPIVSCKYIKKNSKSNQKKKKKKLDTQYLSINCMMLFIYILNQS